MRASAKSASSVYGSLALLRTNDSRPETFFDVGPSVSMASKMSTSSSPLLESENIQPHDGGAAINVNRRQSARTFSFIRIFP